MLQDPAATPVFKMALTAVILQAAIADPDLVQAHLADHQSWPNLLAMLTAAPLRSAVQHAQCLQQLAPSSLLHEPHGSSGPAAALEGASGTQASLNTDTVMQPPAQPVAASLNEQHMPDAQQQTMAGAPSTSCSPSPQAVSSQRSPHDEWLLPEHGLHAAGAASHVAQLITVLIQSQPGLPASVSSYAGTAAVNALLHCYSAHSETAASGLRAPVWPAQAQRQRQQQAMLQHVAEAGVSYVSSVRHKICCVFRTSCL